MPDFKSRRLFRVGKNKDFLVGSVLTIAVVVFTIGGPFLAPHPNEVDLNKRLTPPAWDEDGSWQNLLGTDALGRDIISRILWGARISLAVGLAAVLLAGAIGIPIGIVAGYYGGWIDTILMRIVDIQLSFPAILLALAIAAITGPSFVNVVLAIVLATWVQYARLARGSTMVVKENVYTESARAVAVPTFRILLRYIFPNIVTPLIILATLEVGRAILMESALSFLGLGMPPPAPTWGRMLAEGREYMMVAWWISTFPGVAILITVLGINLLGNGLRLLFDPKLEI